MRWAPFAGEPGIPSLTEFVADHMVVAQLTAAAILGFELVFPLVLWHPQLRPPVALAAVVLHVAIPGPISVHAAVEINLRSRPYSARPGEAIGVRLQDAIDACGDAGGGVVRVPAGTYSLDRDVYLDRDAVENHGAGRSLTTISTAPGTSLIVGLKRSPAGRVL